MPINLNGPARDAAAQLAKAFAADNESQIVDAFVEMQQAIADDVAEQYKDAVAANDVAILNARGFRQLTSDETAYYESLAESAIARQVVATIGDGTGQTDIPTKMMPESIINEVFDNLQETHALLGKINMTSTGYLTTWLRNKHTRQLAVWGAVETQITKEITSAFEVVTVNQGKLAAYVLVTIDMLRLGPTFLDGYIRTILTEALACGLEDGIVNGKGNIPHLNARSAQCVYCHRRRLGHSRFLIA